MKRSMILWPVLIALTASACGRQPAYTLVDSATGRPVAQEAARAPAARGLFNNFAMTRPAPAYAAPQVYAQTPPVPQYQAPPMGGPYTPPPQTNPYAQARWY